MAPKKKETEESVDAPELEPVESEVEVEDDGKIRKKQIYDHVTVATGLRKRDVREAVDATLAYFHQVLSDGHDVQVPPLGKIRAIEKGDADNSKMIYKIQLQKPKKVDDADKEALADGDSAD